MVKLARQRSHLIVVVIVVVLLTDLKNVSAAFSSPSSPSPQQRQQQQSRRISGESKHDEQTMNGDVLRGDGDDESFVMSKKTTTTTTTTRRDWLSRMILLGAMTSTTKAYAAGPGAVVVTGSNDGLLPDLPPDAVRSYLQYRIPLQIAADYYVWELQELVRDPEAWGDVSQMFRASNSRGGQGQPNKMERDYVNPMRIVGLSMPPESSDELREAQFQFEASMQRVTRATGNYRRDLSVELNPADIREANEGWENGRKALNRYFDILNDVTGLHELRTVPPYGPDQTKQYGRSQRQFLDLMKKTKLCQNRGGPALSQAWGQLMVSGYLQDSCGIPSMDTYFFQS